MGSSIAPDPASAALLTVDVQRDIAEPAGPWAVPGTPEAVPAMCRVATAFRRAGRPVIHAVRLYRPDGSNVDLCRRQAVQKGWRVVAPGSPGAELVDGLRPPGAPPLDAEALLAGRLQPLGEREWALYKPRWGAFFGTALLEHLLGLGVDGLVVCGANYPNCPRATLYEASERDLRLALVTDGTSGFYDRGASELAAIGVSLMNADACEAWVGRKAPL